MAQRLSRRVLANYAADQWVSGADRKKLIEQLAAYLVESRRSGEVILLVRDIEQALADRGQVLARIASARPLNEDLESAIVDQLKKDASAEQVEIDSRVDPDLLGGVRVEIPGREYDNTLRRRLQTLKSQTLEKQS